MASAGATGERRRGDIQPGKARGASARGAEYAGAGPGRRDRLQLVGMPFYNGAPPGWFLPARAAWRRAWVSKRRVRVDANSGRRSVVCGPASAIARASLV